MGDQLALDAFLERLREAAIWCSHRSDPLDVRRCLRSDETRPHTWTEYPLHLPGGFHTVQHPKDRIGLVNDVCAKRSQLVGKNQRGGPPPEIDAASGSILLYYPMLELWDGAAELVTNGYFDQDNVPPWDTWLCYVVEEVQKDWPQRRRDAAEFLVSWVPRRCEDLVQEGIIVNPENCIEWAEVIDNSFTSMLRQAHILPALPAFSLAFP